jgi:hypothetical protein
MQFSVWLFIRYPRASFYWDLADVPLPRSMMDCTNSNMFGLADYTSEIYGLFVMVYQPKHSIFSGHTAARPSDVYTNRQLASKHPFTCRLFSHCHMVKLHLNNMSFLAHFGMRAFSPVLF